jgi:alanine racemase
MNFKTYAEINLDNLAYNVGRIREKVAPARVIAVVKANAYGHGAVPVAKRLEAEGVGQFAVAQFQEAMELRESGITEPILVLGRIFPGEIDQAVKAGIRITLFGEEDVRWIEDAGVDLPAFVHVKLETGMGRMGIFPEKIAPFLDRLIQSKACVWEGLFTHFSTSDERDKTYANVQISRFQHTLSRISGLSAKPRIIHMAASGAILDLPASYFTAVRPGILMYGHYPSRETSRSIEPKQVMSLKTFVAHLREMPEGHPISYGRRWSTPKKTWIAVLPVGYADGISRKLTNQGEVLIRGKRYPMVGTVTMDHIMVDVGSDPIQVGDEVLIWGKSPQGEIQLLDVAEKIGTIPYELTCGISRRVRRVYTEAAPAGA